MKIFLGAKFTGVNNRRKLEKIRDIIKDLGHEIFIGPIDIDSHGKEKMPASRFMIKAFEQIKKSQLIIFEHERVGTGIGIEAGFAKCKGKRIILLYPKKAEKSNSLEGISDKIIFYSDFKDLKNKLKGVLPCQKK